LTRCASCATTARFADAAAAAIRELAPRSDGYHRVPPTDALIAAAAAEYGGLAVLHRDGHFDRLAEALAFQSVALPVPSAARLRARPSAGASTAVDTARLPMPLVRVRPVFGETQVSAVTTASALLSGRRGTSVIAGWSSQPTRSASSCWSSDRALTVSPPRLP
jgi:hypothetical protein